MRDSSEPSSAFKQHFAETLRRRLYPNTDIHPKQAAGAIGWSYHAFMAWLRGEAGPPAAAVAELATFFRNVKGDGWFIVELFGAPSEIEAARLRAEMAEIQSRLDAMRAVVEGTQNAPQNHDGGGVVGVAVLPAASGDLAAARGEMHVRLGSEPTTRPRVAAAAPAASPGRRA